MDARERLACFSVPSVIIRIAEGAAESRGSRVVTLTAMGMGVLMGT